MPKYNAWKVDKDCNPIEGTDRQLNAPSIRWVLKHIAYENNITLLHNSSVVKLTDGCMWCVSKIK